LLVVRGGSGVVAGAANYL